MSSSSCCSSTCQSKALCVLGAAVGAAAVSMAMVWRTAKLAGPRVRPSVVPKSIMAGRTVNPIRGVVETIDKSGNPEKEMLVLALGDPTKFGYFDMPSNAKLLVEHFNSGSHNGYVHSAGDPVARAAIASTFSRESAGNPLSADDVVIASGASGAIYLAVQALCNEGDEILVPTPGFALYGTVAGSCGVKHVAYPLDPSAGWSVKLDELEAGITSRTRAIVINNPSNPCGSVFPREHLADIMAIASKYNIPIIADEIYQGMVFEGVDNPSIADLELTVPVLVISGLAKRYMAPGWRVGWVCVYDVDGRAAGIREALYSLAQITLGANSLAQSLIPSLLIETPAQYHKDNNAKLAKSAAVVLDALDSVVGLEPTAPEGAMYCMVRVDYDAFDDAISTDMQFVQGLLDEESVFVLPGSCFDAPEFVRVVFALAPAQLEEACSRITMFCERHRS